MRSLTLLATALTLSTAALADPVQGPLYKDGSGRPSSAQGMFCLKQDGTACNFGDGVVYDGANIAFQGAVPMTVGNTYTAQRSLGVLCTANGNVTFTLADGSSLTLPVYVGWNTFPFAVTSVTSFSAGGAGSAYNLK